jgi:transposase
MASCRLHGINPFEFLKDVFTRLPAAKITEVESFTPAEWAKGRVRLCRKDGRRIGQVCMMKMKDGRTHLAYKPEHAMDLETEAIVAAEVKPADQGDTKSGPETLRVADENLLASGNDGGVQACVADKGYHATVLIVDLTKKGIRTYIPERKRRVLRWSDKPERHEAAFRANRRRVSGDRGRRLSRWRSKRCERTFAHVCETGVARRGWVRGTEEVAKLYRLRCTA